MDNNIIEIPFGAKDSELCGWEYTIPEGMEAVVESGKVIVRRKESEDERIRKELIAYLTHRAEVTGFIDEDKDCKRWIAYLEKQKEQKPAEWSEEDVYITNILERIVGRHRPDEIFKIGNKQGVSAYKICSWLKSLRPQSHWKPSEEQMDALEHFIRSWGESGTMSPQNKILCAAKSLLTDLQKLL